MCGGNPVAKARRSKGVSCLFCDLIKYIAILHGYMTLCGIGLFSAIAWSLGRITDTTMYQFWGPELQRL